MHFHYGWIERSKIIVKHAQKQLMTVYEMLDLLVAVRMLRNFPTARIPVWSARWSSSLGAAPLSPYRRLYSAPDCTQKRNEKFSSERFLIREILMVCFTGLHDRLTARPQKSCNYLSSPLPHEYHRTIASTLPSKYCTMLCLPAY